MSTEQIKVYLKTFYGSDYIRGQRIENMSSKQLHTIYFRVSNKHGAEYEELKTKYISLMSHKTPTSIVIKRANKLSFYQLRDIVKKNTEEYHQITISEYLEGKERLNGNSTEA